MIRVLHLIKTLGLGGAETNLLNLVGAFDSSKVETHVGYSWGGEIEPGFRASGAKLFKYSAGSHKIKSLHTPFIILRIWAYLLKNRINIIHTHNFNAHVWGALAAKLAGCRLVEHVHDFRYEEPSYLESRGIRSSQFKMAGCFAKFSDRIVVLTKNNREFLMRQYGIKPERIALMANGIPLEAARKTASGLRDRFLVPAGKKIVLAAARLSPEKNMGLILDIAKLEGLSEAFFLIAGDGPLKAELEQRVKTEGLEGSVRLIGFYRNVLELLGISDIFIQPTLLELHSITMMEAMSVSVPALVSKGVGCNDDFIADGVNGFLLDPNDPKKWAETVRSLLMDSGLSRRVGLAGRRLVEEQCDIQKAAKKLESLYAGL